MTDDEIKAAVDNARHSLRTLDGISRGSAETLLEVISYQQGMYTGMVDAWEKQQADVVSLYIDYPILLDMFMEQSQARSLMDFHTAYIKALNAVVEIRLKRDARAEP